MEERVFVEGPEYFTMPCTKENIDLIFEGVKLGLWPSNLGAFCSTLNKEEAKRFLSIDGRLLEFMPQFQSNKEVVLVAVENNGNVLRFADHKFLTDYDVALKALQQDYNVITMLNELVKDKNFCIKACTLESGVFLGLPPRFREDLDIVRPVIKYSKNAVVLNYLPKSVLNIPEIAEMVLERNGNWLERLDPKYADDEKYAHIAMKNDKDAYRFLSDRLKHAPEFIDMAKEIFLDEFPEDVFATFNKEYILEAAENGLCGTSLYGRFNVDRDIIKAILRNWMAAYLPPEYSDDKELALIGLGSGLISDNYFQSIAPTLLGDKSFAVEAMEVNPFVYAYLSDGVKDDKETLIKILSVSSIEGIHSIYRNMPEVFKHDQEIIEIILQKEPRVWPYLSPDMQTKENLLLAIRNGISANCIYHREILNDIDVINEIIGHSNKDSFELIPERLLTNGLVKNLLADGVDIHSLPKNHPMRYNKEALMIYLSFPKNILIFEEEESINLECADFDVGLAAVKANYVNFEHLTKELKANPIVRQAAIDNVMEYYNECRKAIPPELQEKEWVIELIKKYPKAYIGANINKEIADDLDVAYLACSLYEENFYHLSPKLWGDNDFLNRVKPYCPDAQRILERNKFLEVFEETSKTKVATEEIAK